MLKREYECASPTSLARKEHRVCSVVVVNWAPALGTVRRDGSVRWWPGLSGAIAVLPVVRRGALREAIALLSAALRARTR